MTPRLLFVDWIQEYRSDSSGQFAIELPEGSWDIVILKQGLTTRRLNGVEVVEGLAPLSVEPASKRGRIG